MIYCQYAKLYRMGISLILCGCIHPYETEIVSREMYETVAQSFLMLAREDVADGKSAWNQGSGVAVVGEDGRHFIYTAKHVLFDKENDGALPTRLYATRMSGKSVEVDLSGISADKELGDPATHPAEWMMIGIAMAIVECGTANQDYMSMLKGFSLANGG